MEWVKCSDRMPPSQNIKDSCNYYLLVMTERYGWKEAMYCDGEFYTSYVSKLTIEVTHWLRVEPPKE